MQQSSLPQNETRITSLNTSHVSSSPLTTSLMTRKHPSKHSKPPRPPSAPLPPFSTPVSTVSAITPKLHSQKNNPAQPLDKQLPKKPAADPRFSKPPTTKADKAAEKAAELAALAGAKASLENKIHQNTTALTAKLAALENNIDTMEEDYIRTTWAHGNVLRGWDGLTRRPDRPEKTPTGNGSGVATGAPKHRKSRPNDRIFSLSSSTSRFRRHNPDVTIQKRPPSNKKKKKRS